MWKPKRNCNNNKNKIIDDSNRSIKENKEWIITTKNKLNNGTVKQNVYKIPGISICSNSIRSIRSHRNSNDSSSIISNGSCCKP